MHTALFCYIKNFEEKSLHYYQQREEKENEEET